MDGPARFEVDEYIVPCQHIREYHHATRSGQDEELKLAVKRYTPKGFVETPDAVTIITGHGNGFPKVHFAQFMLEFASQALSSVDGGLGMGHVWTTSISVIFTT